MGLIASIPKDVVKCICHLLDPGSVVNVSIVNMRMLSLFVDMSVVTVKRKRAASKVTIQAVYCPSMEYMREWFVSKVESDHLLGLVFPQARTVGRNILYKMSFMWRGCYIIYTHDFRARYVASIPALCPVTNEFTIYDMGERLDVADVFNSLVLYLAQRTCFAVMNAATAMRVRALAYIGGPADRSQLIERMCSVAVTEYIMSLF